MITKYIIIKYTYGILRRFFRKNGMFFSSIANGNIIKYWAFRKKLFLFWHEISILRVILNVREKVTISYFLKKKYTSIFLDEFKIKLTSLDKESTCCTSLLNMDYWLVLEICWGIVVNRIVYIHTKHAALNNELNK